MNDTTQYKLLAALEKADLRSQKGREAIHKLIMRAESIRTLSDTIKASSGDRKQYTAGLLALVKLYDCGASVSTRTLCTQAATDGLAVNMLESKIVPLLVDLGIILKLGEKSYQWQTAELIGNQPGLLDALKSSFEVTPAKAALRAAQDAAHDEALKLRVTQKQAAIANKRKATALQAVNASQEAERIAASLPTNEGGAAGWAKQNPTLIIVALLAGIVAIGGQMSGESTQGNLNVQMATLPTTAQIMTGGNP